MNRRHSRISSGPALLFGAGLLAFCGCSDFGSASSASTVVTASFTGFVRNSPGEGHYELWISFALARPDLRHSSAASAGKFRIDELGRTVGLGGDPITFRVSPEDPNARVDGEGNVVWQLAADSFVTIEPAGDSDGEPNLPGLVGGAFVNGVSELSSDYADAFNLDLETASGTFLLATPTTPSTADETEGVWFVAPGGAAASLVLPDIPAQNGWHWGAWYQNLPATTLASLGTFRDPEEPDSDGAGPLGGTGYAYPGSDFPFATTGVDLSEGTIFLTLEPPSDADGGGPFFLRVLEARVNGVAAGTPVTMMPDTGFPPEGTVTIPVVF